MLRFFIGSLWIDETSVALGIAVCNDLGRFDCLKNRFGENLDRKEGKFLFPPGVDGIQGFPDGFWFNRMPAQASFDVCNSPTGV